MLATMPSSPAGPAPKFDIFEQPSSPKRYSQQDLPADLDKSFESSMSISDSFDGHNNQNIPSLTLPTQPLFFGGSLGLAQSLASANQARSFFSSLSTEPSKQQQQQPSRPSPRHAASLGAAMGTTLNARSPGLAAKMSSPKDMDISPMPTAPVNRVGPSPSEGLPKLLNSIHVGPPSAIAGPSTDRLHPVLGGSNRPRPVATERKSSLQVGRLFGSEIAFNSHNIFARDQDLMSSPDKERPLKRRPNSLPTRQSEANERITQLSALMGVATAKPRPALSTAFSNREASFGASSSRAGSSFAARNRLSDSSLPRSSKRSSRAGSAESFFEEDVEKEPSAPKVSLRENVNGGNWQQRSFINEPEDDGDEFNPSPSPSMTSITGTDAGALAGFFNDPLSPEKLGSRLGMKSVERPNLLAAMSSTAASPSASSPPASSPCTRMPPPKRTTSLGPRAFERTRTIAVVPRANSIETQGEDSSSSAAGPQRTNLGKRACPYVKRPSLSNVQPAIKSAYPVLGMNGQTTRMVRPTAPAPRRCVSAFDHSAVLGNAGASKLKAKLIDSPVSPDRRRTQLSTHSEVTDANGSPIAPSMRTRTRPDYLRRGSQDDSSPLAYGTGMRRSGSRGNDAMVDDLALDDPSYVGSPASAESLPGFGASEKEGKVLPCFNVKDDGLMRITPQTMTDLLAGKYTNAIMSYQVVDCRFGYEYDGGHIPGAINLSTVDKVVGHFLRPGQGHHAGSPLPPRSQSGKADKTGNRRKHILIFHCEFSCQRAPTMALALRQADRGLAHDYPNCHFPDIYILQGGYCKFYSEYSNLCEPQQYICMDDPRFAGKRSTELNCFRKEKSFARHRSFTYGEGKRQQSLTREAASRVPSRQSIREEDDAAVVGMEESPCPTGSAAMLTVPSANNVADLGAAAGDTSFGSAGDSSFEADMSPCAAAGSRTYLLPQISGMARRPLLRAGTTGNILPSSAKYLG